MLSSEPSRTLDQVLYRLARSQSCRSGWLATAMSLCHRSVQAAAWSANNEVHPLAAAFCEAATADDPGVPEVSAVSTPTNFVMSYDVPDLTEKATASFAVSCVAVALTSRLGALTVLPTSRVEATVPAVPNVWVAKSTLIDAGEPAT